MTIIKNIALPTDVSQRADVAVQVAADLARAHHAGVTLLHIHEPAIFELPEGYVQSASSQLGRVFDEFNRRLEETEAVLRKHGVQRVETRILSGDVVDEIVKFAADFNYVVMATHGRIGLDRLLLGSVAQKVLERASCTVIVVRRPEQRE